MATIECFDLLLLLVVVVVDIGFAYAFYGHCCYQKEQIASYHGSWPWTVAMAVPQAGRQQANWPPWRGPNDQLANSIAFSMFQFIACMHIVLKRALINNATDQRSTIAQRLIIDRRKLWAKTLIGFAWLAWLLMESGWIRTWFRLI